MTKAEKRALEAYPRISLNAENEIATGGYDNHTRCIYIKGYEQAEKELAPLINRLCEAILFEWKDAADLARKTLTQIKAKEE